MTINLHGFELSAPDCPGWDSVLDEPALRLLADIERRFGQRRHELLAARRQRQAALDRHPQLDFLPDTAEIRSDQWRVRPAPPALLDRRVEITGPVDRKMIINALNSGASCFMADFEDANTPTWCNQINGQIALREAARATLSHTDPDSGKHYTLNPQTAVLLVRPRGLHLDEGHLRLDGRPVSGSFFDFVLYLVHNASALLARGRGPYFYLPKLEHHDEARLWSDVISHCEDALGLERGTVRVTVLIETITAVFQMDEILYALREHICGLNSGRWDYIFSFIKRFARHPDFVLPDRDQVGMTCHFLRSYSRLLINTCHRRGAHAMGGMAAQIPIKGDESANAAALAKVRADKQREAGDGHDGTWVAHPALVPLAREVFDAIMPGANQLDRIAPDLTVTAADLLRVPEGTITETGVRKNIEVGLLYLRAWLAGNGCVPIHHLMEDAATAEISRTQLWQWRRHQARLDDGRTIDDAFIERTLAEEIQALRNRIGSDRHLDDAIDLFRDLVMAADLPEFLTLAAYARVLTDEGVA